ncbi:MAG: hypothetical protein WCR67_00980 [Bacilli bacterium]
MKIDLSNMKKIRRKGHEVFLGHDEILNKFFDIDEEKMLITATIKFEKASDLVDESISKNGNIKLNEAVIQKMVEVTKMIPRVYDINYCLEINNMEDYTSDELTQAFNDSIQLSYYNNRLAMDRKRNLGILLSSIGICVLIASVFLNVFNVIPGFENSVLYEVVDIIGTVFIWEAASMWLIEGAEMRLILTTIKRRIKDIQVKTPEKTIEIKKDEKNILSDIEEKIKEIEK